MKEETLGGLILWIVLLVPGALIGLLIGYSGNPHGPVVSVHFDGMVMGACINFIVVGAGGVIAHFGANLR